MNSKKRICQTKSRIKICFNNKIEKYSTYLYCHMNTLCIETNVNKKKIAFKMLPKCFVIKIDKIFPFHFFLPFCIQPEKYIYSLELFSLSSSEVFFNRMGLATY